MSVTVASDSISFDQAAVIALIIHVSFLIYLKDEELFLHHRFSEI